MSLENLGLVPRISPETEIREVDGEDVVFYAGEQICPLGKKKSLDDKWVHSEPGYEVGRCKMIKRDGQRCKNPVRHGWTVCRSHGAGYASKPGGLTNEHIRTAMHAKHLPNRLIEKYEAFITDPEYISMRNEMALIDTRIADRLEMLDSSDAEKAWTQVRFVAGLLTKNDLTTDDVKKCRDKLSEALNIHGETEVWEEVLELIERRRRLADTERRRIVEAQEMLTVQEANALIANIMNIVINRVKDLQVRRAIADDMRRIMT